MFCRAICTEVPEKYKTQLLSQSPAILGYEPLSQNEAAGFAQMTTAANTSHSPVLMLRAAPISRLWMLRPADSTNRRPMKRRKIGHPCTEGTKPMQRPIPDILLMSSSCHSNAQLLADSFRPSNIQTWSWYHYIHNPLYLPMWTKKTIERQDRQAAGHTSEACNAFPIVPWNPTSS